MKKKLFFTGLFLVSITCFAKTYGTDCKQYAIRAAMAEAEYYGYTNFHDTFEAMLEYRELCEQAKGNIADPIFR